VRRYLALHLMQLRTSMLLAMQYRVDFFLDIAIEIVWALAALVPLFVVFQSRSSIAGWSYAEALVVMGWFVLLQGVLDGAINPSLTTVVEHVRKGTLDFVLIKPADAQFLVSTTRFQPSRAINVITAGVIFVLAFRRIGHAPSAGGIAMSALLFLVACAILYSLWILTVTAAFYVVRIDNLTFLFTAIFDAARWPSSVFKGALRVFFTFVLPLAVMTTFPAEALLGRLPPIALVEAVGGAVVFAVISRLVWLRGMRAYTSASS
jgi:ABC-2 type transport system permease protein